MPIKLKSTGGGSVSIDVPNTGSDFTLTAPANNSTLFTTSGGTITGNVAFTSDVAFTSNNVTIGGSAISSAVGMRNRIINGDMRIDQRNNGSLVTVNSDGFVNRAFPVDRFTIQKSGACVLTGQRTANGVSDFVNSIRTTVTTADSSISASDYAFVQTRLEGLYTSDMMFGTANVKTITLSFWVRSSITGPFYIIFANYSDNRSYPARYTINLANTWEYKTITIPGDTTGTWFTDNSGGLNIAWMIGSGSFGTANAWQGLVLGASDQTQLISTVNATFDLTGVQLEVGSVATSFERRPYDQELTLCRRYFVGVQEYYFTVGFDSSYTSINSGALSWDYDMRVAPSLVIGGGSMTGHHATAPTVRVGPVYKGVGLQFSGSALRSGANCPASVIMSLSAEL